MIEEKEKKFAKMNWKGNINLLRCRKQLSENTVK